jgi:uncharacterized small protein (DUF1192 family)
MGAQCNAIAAQRKDISTVEEQIMVLQRQIARLDARVSEKRGD